MAFPILRKWPREYGLGDTLYSTMAAFFDYDNDGDLDMYLVVNDIPKGYNANVYKPIVTDGSFPVQAGYTGMTGMIR